MGHERVGFLPRNIKWKQVVAQIGSSFDSELNMMVLANSVLNNVRQQYEAIYEDTGVQSAFCFLIGLTQFKDVHQDLPGCIPQIDLSHNPSPIQLTKELHDWVNEHKMSNEYASLAKAAAADTIAFWTVKSTSQLTLFAGDKTTYEIWEGASSGGGFCEITRSFFARFTERYLNYFLEREASIQLPSVNDRQKFSSQLHVHIDAISQHAFETSKITQSFAAGWFNNYVAKSKLEEPDIQRFLSLSFHKLREELLRELQ